MVRDGGSLSTFGFSTGIKRGGYWTLISSTRKKNWKTILANDMIDNLFFRNITVYNKRMETLSIPSAQAKHSFSCFIFYMKLLSLKSGTIPNKRRQSLISLDKNDTWTKVKKHALIIA